MGEFILKYWIQFGFGLIISGTGLGFKILSKKVKDKMAESIAIKAGMVAILHDRLFQACNHYLELEYIPLEKAEEVLDNLKMLYETYHSLGGNGTGTEIYNRAKNLPLKKTNKQAMN